MDKKLETTFRKAMKAVKNAKTSKGSKRKALGTNVSDYEADIREARKWAKTADDGDYLVDWDDTGMSPEEDEGSRAGYSDPELDEIERILNRRDLTLKTDDQGLYASSK